MAGRADGGPALADGADLVRGGDPALAPSRPCSRPIHAAGTGRVCGYEVARRGGQAASRFVVRPGLSVQAEDELSWELTARFGMHTRCTRRSFFLPVSHRHWPLHPAELVHLEDGLLGAAGLETAGPPESMLFSPGDGHRVRQTLELASTLSHFAADCSSSLIPEEIWPRTLP